MAQRNLVLYIAASLDGYIATENHGLAWLFDVEDEGDNGFLNFYDTVDTVLIGRTTYDWIIRNESRGFPYKEKDCYVFSRIKKGENEYVKFTNEDVILFTQKLKQKNGRNIWIVGGGELLCTFIKEKLVDELIITIAPILLGKGIPLFLNNDFHTFLSLKEVNRFNQFVELRYDVVR